MSNLVDGAKKGRPWNITVNTYAIGRTIPLTRGCFAYMFTNLGDTIAFVNGMVIFPNATPLTDLGDSRTISGHKDDYYTGNITLVMDAAAPGTAPLVEIVQLFYTDFDNKQQ